MHNKIKLTAALLLISLMYSCQPDAGRANYGKHVGTDFSSASAPIAPSSAIGIKKMIERGAHHRIDERIDYHETMGKWTPTDWANARANVASQLEETSREQSRIHNKKKEAHQVPIGSPGVHPETFVKD